MWTQSSFGTGFVSVHFKSARWSHAFKRMGQSARADCAVGAKYYLAVRRSWSLLGRRLQCMWTHVVQVMIPITFWIAIRTVFRNEILAHVNTAIVSHMAIELSASTSPEIQEFSGIFGIFKDRKSTFRELNNFRN